MPNNLQTNEELVQQIRNSTGSDQSDLLMQLYNRNYGMIHKIARQYSAFESIQDLEQQAFLGLRIAVDRFDAAEGSFINYAAIWIRQSILTYLEECGSVMRLPRHTRQLIFKYNKVVKQYRQTENRDPDDYELMVELQIDRQQVQKLKADVLLMQPYSLNKVISEEDDTYTLEDAVADPADHFQEVDDQIDKKILKDLLWNEVDSLGTDPADVIKRRFRDQETLQAIADAHGLSKERIRKILSDALRKLKRSKKIMAYSDEYIAKAYSGTGLSAFLTSGSSATERAAIDHYSKQMMQAIKRVHKKYGIQVDAAFIQDRVESFKEDLTARYKA